MAAVLGDLFAIANVAGPLDIRVFVNGVTAFARSVDNKTPILLVGAGVPQDQLLIQNLSVSPIELGVDRGLSYGQGIRVPARSQWSPLGGVQSIWASPNYYDRNPLDLVFHVATGFVGPHGATVRWSYTVPANRRAFFESSFTFVEIGTAPTAPLDRQSYIAIFPAGGGSALYVFAGLTVNHTIPGTRATDDRSVTKELQSGDIAQFITADSSTGGNAAYIGDGVGTEFDA